MDKPTIITVLEDAQLAHKAGDFVNALKFYEQFFDHALDEDPYALYGLRLNHCLVGWGELAETYVGAKNRLIAKQTELLAAYHQNKKPEVFHDFYAVSQTLDRKEEAIDEFIKINNQSVKSAARLVKFVWQDLIKAEHWQLCDQFLEEPVQKLDEGFAIFDEQVRLASVNEQFSSNEFEQFIINQLIESVSELVLVLRNNAKGDDVEIIQRKFFEIAHQKNHSGLNKYIQANGAFLFGLH